MLELWVPQQVPLRDFIAVLISDLFALEIVEDRHGLFSLLLLTKLFVFLHDCVAILKLLLVSLNVL